MKVKCPNCGAEFEVKEVGVVECPYCGFKIKLGETRVFTYPLRVENPWEPLTAFIRIQRLSPNDVEWKSRLVGRELLYVPLYLFFVRARGVARKGLISKDGAGYVEFFNYMTVPAVKGFDELIGYPLPVRGRRYFDGHLKGKLLEKSLSDEEAKKLLKNKVRELLKREAEKYFHWNSVEVGMPGFEPQLDGLVYYPIWRIEYRYGPFKYRAYVDGSDGRVPYAEFPISAFKRITNFVLGALLLASGLWVAKALPFSSAIAPLGSIPASLLASYPSLRRAFTIRGRASEHKLLSEAKENYSPEDEAFRHIRRLFS
ncbi:hypothetical protein [Thermococcus sp.]